MKKAFLFVLGFLFIFGCEILFAVQVEGLYEGKVLVESQSSEIRATAFTDILSQIIIKISGNNQIINNPKVKMILNQASNLVEEYTYMQAPTLSNKPYMLKARFDAEGLQHLLRDAKIPIWSQNRPVILTWILKEGRQQEPEIINQDLADKHYPFLKEKAALRGLPIFLPLVDNKDKLFISQKNFLNVSKEEFLLASKRYQSPLILIGRLMEDATGYLSQWTLFTEKEKWEWRFYSLTEEDNISIIIDHIAQVLAAKYAIITTNDIQKNISLRIVGIKEQNDFTKLIRYLNELTPVAHVSITEIIDSGVILSVSLRSTEQVFTQMLSLNQQLIPVVDPEHSLSFVYKWNPA